MHRIDCELTDSEFVLLDDILGHVGYDDDEAKDMMSLREKLVG